jgi:hypothetical protein
MGLAEKLAQFGGFVDGFGLVRLASQIAQPQSRLNTVLAAREPK